MATSKKIPKVAKVKNKTPAEIQITAEQLLREAKERDLEILPPPPKQKISDPEELADYQKRKRKANLVQTFEDNIRKNRQLISNWIKYAQWEESQKQIERSVVSLFQRMCHVLTAMLMCSLRARSVYERALDVDHRNPTLWLKYAEMEMKNKQINHARNIWDRAVSILPRVNQFWLKYTYMEEMLGNTGGARQVFERWMDWQPYEQAWFSYIKFELRYNDPSNWIRYAQFEANHGNFAEARAIYERAVEFFGDEYMDEKLLIAFAKFEESQREHDRVRAIYKYALDNYPKTQTQEILKNFTIHEKKYGDRADIEDVVINKRKAKYEEELNKNPLEYDTWFDLLRLLESEVDPDSSPDVFRQAVDNTREAYEQAIAHLPPNQEKRYWRRYIYLWIHYAIFEEAVCEDVERAREVFKTCLKIIPHKSFTFAKVWVLAAELEIRQKNLTAARKLLGNAIGVCPKDKLFKEYIGLEMELREFTRCRILYQKFLEFAPENCRTWQK
ncbi:CRNKL1, partial [Cordylochernes scorpioides]